MKNSMIAVLVATTVATLAGCNKDNQSGSAKSGSDNVILIATGSPLSGGQASAGQDFVNGAKLAVSEINAAGGVELDGKKYKLELDSEDDAGDPKTGATVAQKVADNDKIMAVIGHYNSGVTMVAAPIYANVGIPSLTVSTNPDVITKAPKLAGGGVGVFRLNANDGQLGPALAETAQKQGVKKLAILDDATAYGKGVADQVEKKAKALGIGIVVRESATDKTTDFKSVLTKIKAAGADGLMWGGYDDTAATLSKQARELGLSVKLFMPDTSCTDNYLKLAGDASNGAYCASTSVPVENLKDGNGFRDKFQKAYPGQQIQAYAPITYDAVYFLVDAIKKAGSVNRDKIAMAIPSASYDGLSGMMAFKADGERKDAQIAILQANGGKFGVVQTLKY